MKYLRILMGIKTEADLEEARTKLEQMGYQVLDSPSEEQTRRGAQRIQLNHIRRTIWVI